METIQLESVSFPSFKYGCFEIKDGWFEFSQYGKVENWDKVSTAIARAPKSTPLADKVAFYTVGRDLSWGVADAEKLPDPVKKIARFVYDRCQNRDSRHWHKDAVILESHATIPGSTRPGESYVVGIYFQNIAGFKEDAQNSGKRDIIATPETKEEKIWIPEGDESFIVPTRYGSNNRFGLPDETVCKWDSEKAIKRWMETGLTEEQAKRELSRFYRKFSGGGVWSDSNGEYNGPLCIDIGEWVNLGINFPNSTFPLRRWEVIGREQHPQNTMFRIVSEEEYGIVEHYRLTGMIKVPEKEYERLRRLEEKVIMMERVLGKD